MLKILARSFGLLILVFSFVTGSTLTEYVSRWQQAFFLILLAVFGLLIISIIIGFLIAPFTKSKSRRKGGHFVFEHLWTRQLRAFMYFSMNLVISLVVTMFIAICSLQFNFYFSIPLVFVGVLFLSFGFSPAERLTSKNSSGKFWAVLTLLLIVLGFIFQLELLYLLAGLMFSFVLIARLRLPS